MIHNSSVIDKNAKIGKNVKIGPLCYVGPKVQIEDGVEFDEIKHELNPSVYASLKNQPKICAWGNKESLRSRWEKMEKGDFVLFYRNGAFVYC